jgi:hypothetical protein
MEMDFNPTSGGQEGIINSGNTGAKITCVL